MQCRFAMRCSLLSWVLLAALSAFSALSACSSSEANGGDGAAGNAGAAGAAGSAGAGASAGKAGSAGQTGVAAPPTKTGIAVVDRLGAAAAACGPQSSFTVPAGWKNVAVGDRGCAVWVPGAWIVQGAGTAIVSSFSDGTGREGFVGVAGGTQTLSSCAPAPARASLLDGFTQNGYSAPQVLWHVEGTEPFAGSTWSIGHAVFSMSRQSTPLVGYLWVLTLPTVIACDVVGLGFWEPEASIEADTCTALQVLNSVTCPSGGGCDAAECNQSCKNEGHASGSCNPGCECH